MPPTPTPAAPKARDSAAPYPPRPDSDGAFSPNEDGGSGGDGKGPKKTKQDNRQRHLSCENCRIRKMKCSRQDPCLSCRMRGDTCLWVGTAPPNGSAAQDELEQSTAEVQRLKRLVDLLLARLEEQDEQQGIVPPSQAYGATPAAMHAGPSSSLHPSQPPDGFILPTSPLSEPRAPLSGGLPLGDLHTSHRGDIPVHSTDAAAGPPAVRTGGHPHPHAYPPHYLPPGAQHAYYPPYGPPHGAAAEGGYYGASGGMGGPPPPSGTYGPVGGAYGQRAGSYGPGREHW
ncbi:hypothetical protein JCM8097_000382 [Rhodosporidiobolus ruineniae]